MAAIVAASCKKLEVNAVDFNVSTAKQEYKVGDTVTFNFTGNPDNITFYSGELGRKYANKDRIMAKGKTELNFTYFLKPNGSTQTNSAFLYTSTDFNGTVSGDNINAAKWTDITNRTTFLPDVDNLSSGTIDLSDLVVDDKPLFIAFKYMGYSGSAQRTVQIKTFNVVNVLVNEPSYTVTDITAGGWLAANVSGTNGWQISAGSANFFVSGATSAAGTQIANTAWIVSKPLYVNSVSPDGGVPLKNMSVRLAKYDYKFTVPGNYTVVFVAANITADSEEKVVKTLTLEIKP